jgi:hypothetical protein
MIILEFTRMIQQPMYVTFMSDSTRTAGLNNNNNNNNNNNIGMSQLGFYSSASPGGGLARTKSDLMHKMWKWSRFSE